MKINSQLFGKTHQCEAVQLFTLENDRNLTIKISNYGATISSIICPDKNGKLADVALGYDTFQQYLDNQPYMGVTCGRYANRIANGEFVVDNKKYKLAINNGPNALHGGIKGFDKVVWHAVPFDNNEEVGVKLVYMCKDGEEGYPGNLVVEVIISINNLNEINICYTAETDAPTVLNLTNHSYFNLNGGKDTVLNHEMLINADRYTEVNSVSIPTGKLLEVKNTAFDFLKTKKIGLDIEKAGDYDHNFVLNKSTGDELSFAGIVYEAESGRYMEAYTTEPGMQFYTGNYLGGTKGKNGLEYKKYSGFCWEMQHYPDSPNQNHFPSTELNPGEHYTQLTIYKFGVK